MRNRFATASGFLSSGLPRLGEVAGLAVCESLRTAPAGDRLLLISQVAHSASEPLPPLVYDHPHRRRALPVHRAATNAGRRPHRRPFPLNGNPNQENP
ncbi:hypothetical protein CU254_28850 [Amycolatopsis sp. AA4]|nr:hypothetical protein CU254_28850 [Amycolatopsis sp. AA4]EFL10010.1 predicted protein [Streptomyces sp. AA4]